MLVRNLKRLRIHNAPILSRGYRRTSVSNQRISVIAEPSADARQIGCPRFATQYRFERGLAGRFDVTSRLRIRDMSAGTLAFTQMLREFDKKLK